jgi:hypothetical protein
MRLLEEFRGVLVALPEDDERITRLMTSGSSDK